MNYKVMTYDECRACHEQRRIKELLTGEVNKLTPSGMPRPLCRYCNWVVNGVMYFGY